jgi:hypothetical protein
VVIQEANSGLVQKVHPNDKSGKLLPNNHTQGRRRVADAKRRGAVAVSLAFALGAGGDLNHLQTERVTEFHSRETSRPPGRSLTCHKVVTPWRADAMCVEGVAVTR